MAIAGRSILKSMVKKYKVINPFDENHLDGDSYVLTVMKTTTLNYLEHRNLISHEIVFTPPDYVAYLTAKSKFGRMGLSFLNAAKVHSGWTGRLALELVNLSNERQPITVSKGEPLIHIEFIKRDGEPHPYDGPYQMQYMVEKEVEEYLKIIQKYFRRAYDLEKLTKSAKDRILLST